MILYSTKNKKRKTSLREAVLHGLAPDGGLYMPTKIPKLDGTFFDSIKSLSFQEISFKIANKLIEDDVPDNILKKIIDDAINFDAPLVQVTEDIQTLELFHGPTMAFKDFGARFMARLMSYFIIKKNQELTILVATSGDTGSAVAHGFLNVPNIKVCILYPSKKVSHIQEQQLTTMGHNITALEIQGTFDDCQKLVKQAFVDKKLNEKINFSSANSINIARLIPQSFYYFFAYAQLKNKDKPLVCSVPSGNFGNLTAGLIAKKMGLPISKFIAATNSNDIIPKYLMSGTFTPLPSKSTISNAMDVGNPSNFERLLELYNHDIKKIRGDIVGYNFSDNETRGIIKKIYQEQNYLLDPHGAVGYLGLKKYLDNQKDSVNGIFLETAHPAKFLDVVQPLINSTIKIPDRLQNYLDKKKNSTLVPNNFELLKQYFLN